MFGELGVQRIGMSIQQLCLENCYLQRIAQSCHTKSMQERYGYVSCGSIQLKCKLLIIHQCTLRFHLLLATCVSRQSMGQLGKKNCCQHSHITKNPLTDISSFSPVSHIHSVSSFLRFLHSSSTVHAYTASRVMYSPAGMQLCLPIRSVCLDTVLQLLFPLVTVLQQLLLVVQQLFTCLCRVFHVWRLHDSIHRARLLAVPTVNAFCHVNIVLVCTS